MRGIHRWQVNSPHKGPVTRKMFPFDDAIMQWQTHEITAVYFVAYRITTTKFHDKMATPLFERKVLLGQKYLMEMSGLRRQLPPYLLSMHYDHVYGGKVPCLNDKFITFLHIWYPKIKKLFWHGSCDVTERNKANAPVPSTIYRVYTLGLQWRRLDYLHKPLVRRRSKKISKLRVIGLVWGETANFGIVCHCVYAISIGKC